MNKERGPKDLELSGKTARVVQTDIRRTRSMCIKKDQGRVERRLRWRDDFLRSTDHEGRVCDLHACGDVDPGDYQWRCIPEGMPYARVQSKILATRQEDALRLVQYRLSEAARGRFCFTANGIP